MGSDTIFERIYDAVAKATGSKRGAQKEFARLMDVRPQSIVKWETRGIPANRVLRVEAVTGISRHELRPDIFGEQPPRRRRSA